jgi:hypothetical protein
MKREVGRKKNNVRYGGMISCKTFFITILWIFPCFSPLCRHCLQVYWWYYHLIILCVVENSNNDLFQVNFLLIILTLFVMLSFFVVVLQFHLFWSRLQIQFKVNYPMLFLFIYNLCKLKWWHQDYLAIPSIVTSFINNFIQVFPCHLAFIVVLLCCFKNM